MCLCVCVIALSVVYLMCCKTCNFRKCFDKRISSFRYADRVKELGVSENAEDNYKNSPTEKEPDENGTNDVDYSRLSNLNVSLSIHR